LYHWWCILLTRHNTTDYCNYKWCMSYIIRSQPSSRDAPKNQAELAVTSARPAKFKVPRQPTVGGVASKVMLWICLKMECPNFDTVEWENDEKMMRTWWENDEILGCTPFSDIFRHTSKYLYGMVLRPYSWQMDSLIPLPLGSRVLPRWVERASSLCVWASGWRWSFQLSYCAGRVPYVSLWYPVAAVAFARRK